MSINNHIDKLIEKNKHIKPVNQTTYQNPYLLLSETRALNELVSNMRPSTRAETEDIDKKQPPPLYDSRRRSPSSRRRRSGTAPEYPTSAPTAPPTDAPTLGHGNTIYEPSVTEEQNLARHVMSEVYKNEYERRDIEGYTKLESLGDDRNVVYKSNKDNTVLYGIRGTADATDWLTDLEIGIKSYLTDKTPQATMNERFDATQKIYSKIRELYPKSKIIMGAHSLGNAVGLDVLYKNKDDSNMSLYGYNGFNHPLYVGNNDPRNNPQRTAYDIVSWWDKKAGDVKGPPIKQGAVAAASLIGGMYAYQNQLINDMTTSTNRQIDAWKTYASNIRMNNQGAMRDWGIKWDANNAERLALELETPTPDISVAVDANQVSKKNLMTELESIMPETPTGVSHNEMLEIIKKGRPVKETLADLGFVGESLQPEITQAMLDEQAELYTDVADKRVMTLVEDIAARTGTTDSAAALLIAGVTIAGIFAAHRTENFEPEKNLFINKKKDDDDEL